MIQPGPAKKISGYERIVLPVGLELSHALTPHLGDYPGPLVQLQRKPGRKDWLLGKVKPAPSSTDIPAAFDPRPSLYRLWGIRPPEPAAEPGYTTDEPAAEPSRNGTHRLPRD